MDTRGLETLLAVTLVAALAPMIVAALPGPRVPQVVILILAGILIGPHVLGLDFTPSVRLIANLDEHLRSRTSAPDATAATPAASDGWAEVR